MRTLLALLALFPLALRAQNTTEEDDLYANWLDRPSRFEAEAEPSLSAFEDFKRDVYERGNTRSKAPELPQLSEEPQTVEDLRETWGEESGTANYYDPAYDPYAPNGGGNWTMGTGFYSGPYGASSYMGLGYQWGNPSLYGGYPNYYSPYYPGGGYYAPGYYNGGYYGNPYYGAPVNPNNESSQPVNNNPRPRGGGNNTIVVPPAQPRPSKPVRIESPSSSPSYSSPSSSPSYSPPSSSPSSSPSNSSPSRNKPNRF